MQCPACRSPHPPEARFCPNCGAKLFAATTAPRFAGHSSDLPDLSLLPINKSQPGDAPPTSAAVKVFDAGDRLVLSGSREIDVQCKLDAYLAKGAKLVTQPCQVGSSWAAACTIPPKTTSLDDTDSLTFADPAEPVRPKSTEPDDGCRVEEIGFKRMIYAPSKIALRIRVERMKQFGAKVISEIEEVDGEWVVVCDVGGANTGYRW
jgi:zinc ribbon protein